MIPISSAPKLTRRTMLKATAAVGAGLVLSVSLPRLNAVLATEPDSDFEPSAFVRIDPDGKTTFTIPQVEMGQGIYTALSMLLAEELDAPFEHVTAVASPPDDKLYGNPLLGFQVTGGSTSVRAFWKPMRLAGATAQAMLVQAAATKWSVDPASCRTENGEVIHDASAQKASYGELVQAAADCEARHTFIGGQPFAGGRAFVLPFGTMYSAPRARA
jgi:isoquinoline 1-oxidoreductase subunit beta